ncbi:hypothetical protein [Nostoc sp. UHCC 0870]|uniref:hypothetical protein n=1 Tax=Nostoc sp. UHCC 0870 TaxID=2914041 RepID=UPI001EE0CC0B|nr:hypothetical protein [Nostoc sp. UHCC 0870]UKO98442.1 hypothetical protein L6494_01495 [Nostoc sp. UHCC 0870]
MQEQFRLEYMKIIKQAYKDTFIFDFVQNLRGKQQLQTWKKSGTPSKIPHFVKEQTVLNFAHKFSIQVLIETGTFKGDMISACRNKFSKIYSIELDQSLYNQAKLRFKKFKHIYLSQGDSGVVLPQLMKEINEPCLFWLDGHYSGGITARGDIDTPISAELNCILNHQVSNHLVLIDDAHEFTGQNGYPKVEDLKSFINQNYPNLKIEVSNNIIRIYPRS